MWVSRSTFEAYIRENQRLATMAEWLAAQVTQLEKERAVLLERVLNVELPTREVGVEARDIPIRGAITPDMLKGLYSTLPKPPAPDVAPGQVFKPATEMPTAAIGDAQAAAALFEDVGDEIAEKLGLDWDAEGQLISSR